jgi:hypothetical protein
MVDGPVPCPCVSKSTTALNAQADHAWDAIRLSPLAGVYLTEVYASSSAVVASIDAADSLLSAQDLRPGSILVNHDVNRHFLNAIGAAARLRALLFERDKNRHQQPLEHKIQQRRAGWLKTILAGVDLDVLKAVGVRHTIEHFDEYIDRLALRAYDGDLPLPAIIPVDFVLGSRDLFKMGIFSQYPVPSLVRRLRCGRGNLYQL